MALLLGSSAAPAACYGADTPHAINTNPAKPRRCVFCSNFKRISGANTVECMRFGHHSPARETSCAFREREPGAGDEADAELWRSVMERLHPTRQYPPLRPRTPAEVRAVIGSGYGHIGTAQPPAIDPIDAEDEADALIEALGPLGRLIGDARCS